MGAQLIDGRACARSLKQDLRANIATSRRDGPGIGLATVMVGDGFGSAAYQRRLRKLADELGVPHRHHQLDQSCSQDELIAVVEALGAAPDVSGILVLRPLPGHIDEASVFRALHPLKDVEAVHPENAGLLSLGVPRFVPSTAASAYHLLDSWVDSLGGERADFYRGSVIVVVGRSNNVGKPAISLGYSRQAAVESVDEWADRTTGLGRHTRRADVLIVAAGKPGLIKAEHVAEHAVVIDVGINPQTGPDGRMRMVGDVDFGSVAPRVRAITPVPGGVGPVTDVWLLHNTVLASRFLAGHEVTGTDSLSAASTRTLVEAS
jgi:methylenetetrahydrofolate dehydrogenase (NADP+)/methenyltetrahydrofolate cyclohydrolase